MTIEIHTRQCELFAHNVYSRFNVYLRQRLLFTLVSRSSINDYTYIDHLDISSLLLENNQISSNTKVNNNEQQ
jgi:hypothetical protein